MFIGSVAIGPGNRAKEGLMATRRSLRAAGLFGLIAAFALALAPVPGAGQDKSTGTDVKARIEEKFKQAGLFVGNDIQIAVEGKTITLTGTVRTLAQKEQAGREALGAAKGHKLVNDLALASVETSPRQIADGIVTAIETSPSYYIFDYVGVDVTSAGEVTLKGWAQFPWSEKEFVKLAQSQPGVQKVSNEIQPLMIMDADRALRARVAQVIYTRPTGPSFTRMNGPIHIIVNNGVVILGGTVQKQADVDGFERLVRSNSGALNVVNNLQVKTK
jgi:osmotically-inducible protein OsmY